MNWIDDRIKQRQVEASRSAVIDSSAEQIFNDLWDEINRWVAEAKQKNLPVFTNGTPYERIVSLSVPPPSGRSQSNPRQLTIRLAREKKAIVVGGISAGGQSVQLTLDVCDDGVICIKHYGERVSVSEIAMQILDHFLFPELQTGKL